MFFLELSGVDHSVSFFFLFPKIGGGEEKAGEGKAQKSWEGGKEAQLGSVWEG